MEHKIRRQDHVMNEETTKQVLQEAEYGILALNNDEQPYGVPLSYAIMDDHIYFHCALQGSKLTYLEANNKVCFTVVGKTQPIYDKNFTTYYQSVMIFGKAYHVKDNEEKETFLKLLCEKYLPNEMNHFKADVTKSLPYTNVYKISMDVVTGKEKK